MSDKFLDRINNEAKTSEIYSEYNSDDVAKILSSYIEPVPVPSLYVPVLAFISVIGDSGKSEWYEVVYHNGEEWESYAGSNTFNDGERVLKWKYCNELL